MSLNLGTGLSLLQLGNESVPYYVSLQPGLRGTSSAEYVSTQLQFNPATGSLSTTALSTGTTTVSSLTVNSLPVSTILDPIIVNGVNNIGIRIATASNTASDFTALRFFQGGSESAVIYTNQGNGVVAVRNNGTLQLIASSVIPSGNVSQNLGSPTTWWNLVYGRSVQAQYADLAENYTADNEYLVGTVVVFGGEKEITITTLTHDTCVAGVISTNPAYLMNAANEGLPVALTGRVPCKVHGPVNKGTVLVTSETPGVACAINYDLYKPGCVLGKSLDSIKDDSIQTIEIVVGRF